MKAPTGPAPCCGRCGTAEDVVPARNYGYHTGGWWCNGCGTHVRGKNVIASPTHPVDYVQVGDECESLVGGMLGKVEKIIERSNGLHTVVVKWASGSTGRHTITTLKKAIPEHCTECDGSGYHTGDCPRKLDPSAWRRK